MDRILGQPGAVEALQAGLRSGRLAHAWIFAGPRGVGKFTTAIELSRIVLDRQDDGETSRLIDVGVHPDLHVIRKELALYSPDSDIRKRKQLNISVGVLRQHMIGGQVGEKYQEAPAYRTPARGHNKVFIIDEAELLDAVGQNALLKTLEEPPAGTYIILVTNRPQRLLPTVHSRCRHLHFRPLDDAAMAQWFDQSDVDASGAERQWINEFCDGSPGVASLAAQYGFYRWHTTLAPMLEDLAVGRFPAAMGETLAALVESFAVEWVKRHENASKDAANKDGLRFMLSILAAHANRQLAESVQRGTDAYPAMKAIDLIAEAETQAWAHVNLKLLLENLVVQWARVGAAISIP
jgi:hypothetical protein